MWGPSKGLVWPDRLGSKRSLALKGQTMTDAVEGTVERPPVEVVLPATAGPLGDARREFAEQLVDQARAQGLALVGPDGLLADTTKRVLETGLEVGLDEPHQRSMTTTGNGYSVTGTVPRRDSVSRKSHRGASS